MGQAAAPVEVIEYASTTCGHCKAFHDSVLPDLKTKYIDTGKAKLVYRVMPTPPPELAMAGAAIARCAGEAKYFAVIDDLFKSQDDLLSAARQPRRLQQRLIELGGRHGLSADEVGTCIDDDALHKHSMDVARSAPPSITRHRPSSSTARTWTRTRWKPCLPPSTRPPLRPPNRRFRAEI